MNITKHLVEQMQSDVQEFSGFKSFVVDSESSKNTAINCVELLQKKMINILDTQRASGEVKTEEFNVTLRELRSIWEVVDSSILSYIK